jgi:hypothetical protein
VQKNDIDSSPNELNKKLAISFPGIQNFTLLPNIDPAVYEAIRTAVTDADLVIFSLFVQRTRTVDAAPFRADDLALFHEIIASHPHSVIAMSYGNPHLIRKIGDVSAFVVGYGEGGWFGNQLVYFESFIKLLRNEIKPQGKLPVKVSDRYPIGFGLFY